MNIITWNVNRFDGTLDWYNTNYDLEEEGRKFFAKKIYQKLELCLEGEDDIAILQEFPSRELKKDGDVIFEAFKNIFTDKFIVHTWYNNAEKNNVNKTVLNLTVAIAKNSSAWALNSLEDRIINYGKENNKYNYINRYVELHNNRININLFGCHFNTKNEMWKGNENILKEFDILLGDFNISEEKTKKTICDELRETHHSMINTDIVTQNQCSTSIDKIYIKKDLNVLTNSTTVLDYIYFNEREKRYIRFSDHNLCMVSLATASLFTN